jgi:hypothetical protein
VGEGALADEYYITASTRGLPAAMARRGLGLCLTYASVTIARGSTEYLSIGRDGVYLELALAFPPSGYRSKATRELARIMHEEIGEL